MKYFPKERQIKIDKELSDLDLFVIDFLTILEKHIDYVLISGYISILLGRSRATEDVDVFIKKLSKEKFSKLYEDLKNNNFWCINSENIEEVYSYLKEGLAIRFSRRNQAIPNFEVKFCKNKLEEETFNDSLIASLPNAVLRLSSLERQIAFKKYSGHR